MERPIILPFAGHAPVVAADAFVAPGAVLVGQVVVAAGASVWFHAVLRADLEPIRVGRLSNVQDHCVLHADPGFPVSVGERVTLGHGAVVHGATVEDDALIGMQATVLNGAVVGRGAVVGAGALVPAGKEIPPGSLAVGVPARVLRALAPEELEANRRHAEGYAELARRYRA